MNLRFFGTSTLPIVLFLILYTLIFLVRAQQGGFEIEFEAFKDQRAVIDQKISQLLPSPQAEILQGILLGENKNLPAQVKLALRDTSTLHIVVASGQNLSLLAGFFLNLAGLIKRKNALILAQLAVLIYVLLVGAQVPILRAAAMFTLSSLASFFGREKAGWWILVVTAGLMLLINPSWIASLSFQLSFLATFGVVIVTPIFLKYFKDIPLIGQDLAVSLSAQLMVTPVIAQNFHQFSLVGLVTNLLVLWTIPFIMIAGAVLVISSLIWDFAAQAVSMLVYSLLSYFLYIIQFFASLNFAWIYVPDYGWVFWIGYYLVVLAVLLIINRRWTLEHRR